jgi:hypothetical protein
MIFSVRKDAALNEIRFSTKALPPLKECICVDAVRSFYIGILRMAKRWPATCIAGHDKRVVL